MTQAVGLTWYKDMDIRAYDLKLLCQKVFNDSPVITVKALYYFLRLQIINLSTQHLLEGSPLTTIWKDVHSALFGRISTQHSLEGSSLSTHQLHHCFKTMVFSEYTKQRILFFYEQGLRSTAIQKELQKEDIRASVVGIWKFLQWYKKSGTIERQPGSGRTSIVTPRVEATMESQMEDDDETTASQLQMLLTAKGCSRSLSAIQRSRSRMGWTFSDSARRRDWSGHEKT